ncbi:hypothetical protein BC361_29880 [Ensifer sp. LC54]|nr:hypothetical protein BC363_31830 [Ensifer sp. LC384]OCP19734.1 hypothetical protein BC361_29880 [Ensifer sp. LC54]
MPTCPTGSQRIDVVDPEDVVDLQHVLGVFRRGRQIGTQARIDQVERFGGGGANRLHGRHMALRFGFAGKFQEILALQLRI